MYWLWIGRRSTSRTWRQRHQRHNWIDEICKRQSRKGTNLKQYESTQLQHPELKGKTYLSQLSLQVPKKGRMTRHHRNTIIASNRTLDICGSTDVDRPTEPIEGSELINTAPRRSGWDQRPNEFYQQGLDYINYTDEGEPSTFEEVIAARDADTWLQAMRSGMDLIHQNDTWELVKLPVGRKPPPYKWVFRYKYVSNSEKPKYKARLVAKGFK